MKRYLYLILIIILSCVGGFGVYKLKVNFGLDTINNKLTYDLIYKGITGAEAVTFGNNGEFYIAMQSEIIKATEGGVSESIIKDNDLSICSIAFYKNKIYFVSNTTLYFYDLTKKEKKIVLNNIPNYGDYKKSKLLLSGDSLFLTIGAATNSGVVGDDNDWKKTTNSYDLTPKPITLSGKSSGGDNNGIFLPYGNKGSKGQVIGASPLGNATIIKINLLNNNHELYAWGVRNVEGIDSSSTGNIYAVVGGIEERGLRPVYGDKDYIYEIKGGARWYGWPDYSGGDPVDSPRFRQEGKPKTYLALENPPTINPEAPIYQHSAVKNLYCLAIDKSGNILKKDSMFVYDDLQKEVLNISIEGIIERVIKVSKASNINDIKIQNSKVYMLDGKNGYLYSVYKKTDELNMNLSKTNLIYLLSLTIILIGVFVVKLVFTKGNKK
ncbi:hypothetical protein SAMN02745163_00896 [Clostridium cavendishii DSM 21758]|uniref:Glucose / Sorbosone dehydrogenase n=1 Tax=Clostridium cavendishii DSM 21758 TaxID=1121302 RepID=A0A1M6EMV0_9CLOT|nr:hypothetical protein [Clostridium cavendishii]SHI86877.1 hypothetical protein SAMN02745163_00896 [Clostridium cavendishii DSM 21758]